MFIQVFGPIRKPPLYPFELWGQAADYKLLTAILTVFKLNCVTHWQAFMAAKETQSQRRRSWPNVYSCKRRSGQVGCIVDLGLGKSKRERHPFKAKAEAHGFAEPHYPKKVLPLLHGQR